MRYFYTANGSEVLGPSTADEIRELLSTGALPAGSQVCIEGEETWRAVSDVLGPRLADWSATPLPSVPRTLPEKRTAEHRKLLPLSITLPLAILLVAGVGFVLWQRGEFAPRQDAEIQRLKQEIEQLKKQASVPIPSPPSTPLPDPPDYQNFMRLARRLLTALESGTSFADFHQRTVDIIASAEEAVRLLPSPEKQKNVAVFALAVKDADDLWNYKATYQQQNMFYNEAGTHFEHGDHPRSDSYGPPSGRWDSQLSTLVSAYKLDEHKMYEHEAYSIGPDWFNRDKAKCPRVEIDPALKQIFAVCQETFSSLEASK